MAAPPLDSPCDRLVTYPGDIKTLRIPSKGRSGLTLYIYIYKIIFSTLIFKYFIQDSLQKKSNKKTNKNPWRTDEIKVMCQHKKNLYLLSRSSIDLELKNSYISYCKSLTKSITEAKKELGIKSKYYLIMIKLKYCGILLKLKWTGMVT